MVILGRTHISYYAILMCLTLAVLESACSKANRVPVSQISIVKDNEGNEVVVSYANKCNIDNYFYTDVDGLKCLIDAIKYGYVFTDTFMCSSLIDSIHIQTITFLGKNEIGVQQFQIKADCYNKGVCTNVKIPLLYNGNGYAEYDISDIADKEIYDLFWKEKMRISKTEKKRSITL